VTILSAEAFEEFERYLENPTCTERGKALIAEAYRRYMEETACRDL
jgi:hypothetical protein